MDLYEFIKIIHVISSTVVLGVGVGVAYFIFSDYRNDDRESLRIVVSHAARADWVLTMPAVVVQFLTGLWLTANLGIPYGSAWFIAVNALFILIGFSWLSLVKQHKHIEALAGQGAGADPDEYARTMRLWMRDGLVTTGIVVIIFVLMTAKPGADWIVLG